MNEYGFTGPEQYGQMEITEYDGGSTTYLGNANAADPNMVPLSNLNLPDLSNVTNSGTTGASSQPMSRASNNNPDTHIVEFDDKIIILVQLPGVDKEAVTIDFDEPFIRIKGDRKHPFEEFVVDGKLQHKEILQCKYGEFKLEYKMTKQIDRLDAKMENGVLQLDAIFKRKSAPEKVSIK